MTQTVYIKLAQITQVSKTEVNLSDVAEVYCSDKSTEARCRAVPVLRIRSERPMSYVKSVTDIIKKVTEEVPGAEINSIGEQDFVIAYQPPARPHPLWQWSKAVFVSIICFTGAAFAIMTFNNDANVSDVFGKIFFIMTGHESDGVTVLEFGYSLGLALGIILFFNHFAGWKISTDPTPLEVEMRLYEENVNKTLIQNGEREEAGVDVS